MNLMSKLSDYYDLKKLMYEFKIILTVTDSKGVSFTSDSFAIVLTFVSLDEL